MARFLALVLLAVLSGCGDPSPGPAPRTASAEGPCAILLVSHGSRSKQWRQGLLDFEERIRASVLDHPEIGDLRSGWMEYNEPSIATRLRELDAEGYARVIIVPLLLTVSSHSFDDIPTIIGLKEDRKSLETLRIEGIERYDPRAEVTVTPLIDFAGMLLKNVRRRAEALGRDPKSEGLVLVAYGSGPYREEWEALLSGVGEKLRREDGYGAWQHAWCGHLVHYDPAQTTQAVNRVLSRCDRALVIPILVAVDEMFQGGIIRKGVAASTDPARVLYKEDAILPDPDLERWVVGTALSFAKREAR